MGRTNAFHTIRFTYRKLDSGITQMISFKNFVQETLNPSLEKLKKEVEAAKAAKLKANLQVRKDVMKATGTDPNKILYIKRGTGSMGG